MNLHCLIKEKWDYLNVKILVQVLTLCVYIQSWRPLCHRWVGSIFWYLKELEDVLFVLHCITFLFPHCHGECHNPSKLFRSNNGYSNSSVTILYIVITKAILSSAFQFQSQHPSFICITKTNGKHISARVRLIMVSVKVFLMIQFEAVISRGRKFHLLGVFYLFILWKMYQRIKNNFSF